MTKNKVTRGTISNAMRDKAHGEREIMHFICGAELKPQGICYCYQAGVAELKVEVIRDLGSRIFGSLSEYYQLMDKLQYNLSR